MNWALTTMASGRILWLGVLLAGVVLGILAVHWPKIYTFVTAPFRALWAKGIGPDVNDTGWQVSATISPDNGILSDQNIWEIIK